VVYLVLVTAHYPSDVIFGAYIGVFIALWAYRFLKFDDGMIGGGGIIYSCYYVGWWRGIMRKK
jgi:membrane-associated phospholipid phosphatase